MPVIEAQPPHFHAEDTPDGLLVTIEPGRAGCATAFLTVWLIGWAFGEVAAARALFGGGLRIDPAVPFLFVWLAGWTAGGGAALWFWAMSIAGRQYLAFDGARLTSRVEAFGIGQDRAYDLGQVRRLRVATLKDDDESSYVLRFDHGAGTVDLVKGLSEPELALLHAEIVRRHPALATG